MQNLQNPTRGFLMSTDLDPAILVEFQYNPAQLTDKRAVNYSTLNAPGLLLPVRQYSQGGDRTLSFTIKIDGLFKGPADDEIDIAKDDDGSITPELNKYRAFLYPKNADWESATDSFQPLYAQTTAFEAPPMCVFGFGERLIDCIVTDVGITETLFNAQLKPLRADVTVTLVETAVYGNEPVAVPAGG